MNINELEELLQPTKQVAIDPCSRCGKDLSLCPQDVCGPCYQDYRTRNCFSCCQQNFVNGVMRENTYGNPLGANYINPLASMGPITWANVSPRGWGTISNSTIYDAVSSGSPIILSSDDNE